ncbi:MAG: hypothetical protein DMG03_10975 [Acidobacteria bacterium]|nr:MAG: hypothetical protein DMG03_10975 [Acidobacteriota bacterium]
MCIVTKQSLIERSARLSPFTRSAREYVRVAMHFLGLTFAFYPRSSNFEHLNSSTAGGVYG